jgi:hypothetical protein
MIMRSNKGIATLAQISLVMDVSYCKHNEGARVRTDFAGRQRRLATTPCW